MSAPSADGWTRAAIGRSAFLACQSLQDECERLRAALADADRDLRVARVEIAELQAARERERADWERRIDAAVREARHDARRTAKHGGRLLSILHVGD